MFLFITTNKIEKINRASNRIASFRISPEGGDCFDRLPVPRERDVVAGAEVLENVVSIHPPLDGTFPGPS